MTLSACRARTDRIAPSTLCSSTRTRAASSSGGTTVPNGSSAQAPRSRAAAMIPPRRISLVSGGIGSVGLVGVPAGRGTVLEGDHEVEVGLPGIEPCVAVGHHVRAKRRDRCVVGDRKSTRLNSSHLVISYAVFCLKK